MGRSRLRGRRRRRVKKVLPSQRNGNGDKNAVEKVPGPDGKLIPRYSATEYSGSKIVQLIPAEKPKSSVSDPELMEHQRSLAIECFQQGFILLEAKRYEEAIDKYNVSLAVYPDQPEAYYNLAVCYRRVGNYAKARDAALECLRMWKTRASVWSLFATVFLELKKYKEAEEACCMALQLKAKNEKFLLDNLGKALWAQQRYREACEVFEDRLKFEDDSTTAHYYLGNNLLASKDFQPAEIHLRKAIDLSPRHKEAWYLLGTLLCSRGVISEAQGAFDTVLQMDPKHSSSQWKEFTVSVDKKVRDVVAGFKREYRIPESSVEAYLQLCWKLIDENKYSEAKETLSTGSIANLGNDLMAKWRGIACALCLDYDGTIAALERFHDKSPEDDEIKLLLGLAYIITCRKSDAFTMLRKIEVEVDPEIAALAKKIPLK